MSLPVSQLEKSPLPNGLGVFWDRSNTSSIPTLASNDLRKIVQFRREVKTDGSLRFGGRQEMRVKNLAGLERYEFTGKAIVLCVPEIPRSIQMAVRGCPKGSSQFGRWAGGW